MIISVIVKQNLIHIKYEMKQLTIIVNKNAAKLLSSINFLIYFLIQQEDIDQEF